jgi:SAM-dependent methyltransferase
MPGYIGDLRKVLVQEFHWNSMFQLADVVKRGHPTEEVPPQVVRDSVEYNSCFYKLAATQLHAVLSPWTAKKQSLSILDYGCGSGIMGFTLLQKMHNIHLVCSVDTPDMIQLAQETAKQMGINTSKVMLFPYENSFENSEKSEGDLEDGEEENNNNRMKGPLSQGPFDLLIFGRDFVNTLGRKSAKKILHDLITKALKPTGRIILCEAVSDIEGGDSPNVMLHSISMLVSRKKGKVHDKDWFKELLSEVGLVAPSIYELLPFPEKIIVSYRSLISHKKGKK